VSGLCEHGSEPLGFIKAVKVIFDSGGMRCMLAIFISSSA
jgi:hypothetical protein